MVRSSILLEHLWTLADIPSSEGARTQKWKYFRYRFIQAPEELYNLEKEPLEQYNLATDTAYTKIKNKLKLVHNTTFH